MKKCLCSVALLLLSGMLFQCYYVRQGVTLFDIYASGEDIDRALAGPQLSPEERTLLIRVKEIKAFAAGRLGLADNRNYTSYIRINRDFLAAVVSACDRLSFTQYQWRYLFAGDLPYMGFFNAEEAASEASRLRREGKDTYVRPVDAFSTLGLLSDPVFSFMKKYPTHVLAEIILHEQTHATVFLTGQATFNENLASFVGEEGMRLFILEKFGEASDEYRTAAALDRDRRAFAAAVQGLYDRLAAVYARALPDAGKTALKDGTIQAWKDEYRDTYHDRFQSDLYLAFADREINNAVIMTYMNYTAQADDFRALYALCRRDLPVFISLARKLKNNETDPLAALRVLIEQDLAHRNPGPRKADAAPDGGGRP